MDSLPRRRSCLSVPGASEKMLGKALGLPADEIVLDLEDSVPADGKPAARSRVAEALASATWQKRLVSVRINAIGSRWCHEDILAVVASRHPRLTLVVPKVESVGDLAFLDRLLRGVEAAIGAARNPIGLQVLIETAAGLAAVQTIASASQRLETLILGYADLASSLGRPAGSQESWGAAQDAVLLAARANGLQAIDGPYMRMDADETMRRDSEHACQLGFDGKWAIHPSHIETLNAVFTPSGEEVSRARSLLAHLDAAQKAGAGATSFGGGMVDEAMRRGALRTLARAGE